jgi:hypothetical protein
MTSLVEDLQEINRKIEKHLEVAKKKPSKPVTVAEEKLPDAEDDKEDKDAAI